MCACVSVFPCFCFASPVFGRIHPSVPVRNRGGKWLHMCPPTVGDRRLFLCHFPSWAHELSHGPEALYVCMNCYLSFVISPARTASGTTLKPLVCMSFFCSICDGMYVRLSIATSPEQRNHGLNPHPIIYDRDHISRHLVCYYDFPPIPSWCPR